MKFKTNIKCGGCIATVSPVLDQAVGAGNWQVDLVDPAKILDITADAIDAQHIQKILAAVGYQADVIVAQ
jgi:copper chaperone